MRKTKAQIEREAVISAMKEAIEELSNMMASFEKVTTLLEEFEEAETRCDQARLNCGLCPYR